MCKLIHSCLILLQAGILFATTAYSASPRYEVLNLDEGGEMMVGFPLSINSDGIISGHSSLVNDGFPVATIWVDGRASILGRVDGDKYSESLATNLNGQSIGHSTMVIHEWGFFYTYPSATLYENGEIHELETLVQSGPNWELRLAYDINDAGQVVGYARDYVTEEPFGFLFHDGVLSDLGSLGSADGSMPYAINNAGQVVGQSWTTGGQNHAFVWTEGRMTDLGTFGGRDSRGMDINELGQVVGGSEMPMGNEHPVLWFEGETLDLGTFGGNWGNAEAINDLGQIVGMANDENEYAHMFMWEDSVMIDPLAYAVNEGWGPIGRAFGINNAGQIVGTAQQGFYEIPAVLTPVDLELSPVYPGMAGMVNYVDVSGLTPGEEVELLNGSSAGMTKLSDCDGATVLISEPRIAGSAIADESGKARIEVYVRQGASGHTFRLQAAQSSGCLVSNVVTVAFE